MSNEEKILEMLKGFLDDYWKNYDPNATSQQEAIVQSNRSTNKPMKIKREYPVLDKYHFIYEIRTEEGTLIRRGQSADLTKSFMRILNIAMGIDHTKVSNFNLKVLGVFKTKTDAQKWLVDNNVQLIV